MSAGKIAPIISNNADLQRLQDNILNKVNQFSSNPFINGVAVNDVSLAVGNNEIPHGLNRPYEGVIITKRSSAANIYDFNPTDSRRFVGLNSSAVCVVNLWVY
jgi:hypothetical protein